MIQQITPMLSSLRLTHFFRKNKTPLTWCLSAMATLWLVAVQANPVMPSDHTWLQSARLSPAGDTSITETICANEFLVFNGDTLTEAGQYSSVLVAADGTDSIVSLDLFVLPVSTGAETATICAGTTYDFHGEVLSLAGTYASVLTAYNGCDSTVTLTLTVRPNALTKLEASICSGSYYPFQGDSLSQSGYYTVVFPSANGCDSIVGLTLNVVPFFKTPTNATICAGESYVFQGDTLKVAGTYADTLTATGGCDSILTLVLKVLPAPLTNLEVGVCTGFTYDFAGETLDASGIYTDTLTAVNGCDSIVVLKLTVADFFDIQQKISICAGETYVFGNETLNTEGIYVHELVAAGGCDSTVTLSLAVLPVQTGTAEASLCQGDTLAYNGELLTDAGVYMFTLTGVNGCDSTVTFTLNVLPTVSTALAATICAGATYDFAGDTLETSGTYVHVLDAANGCDSTVTLTLKVLPVSHTDILATICAGENYYYEGDTLTNSGNYPYVFTGANGCDSTVTIVLTVRPTQNSVSDATICANETYVFDGDSLDQAGTYTAIFTGANGCDSTVVLTLNVLPVQTSSLDATTCAGTDYVFNGDSLDQSGVYTATLTSLNGCDSIVTLHLTVLPTHDSTITAVTCANEPYLFHGQVLTVAGSYPFVVEGSNGCDSTVTLVLTVLPVAQTTIAASVCAGETYEYAGDTLTASGTYAYIFPALNGCDSTITIQLTVRPLLSSLTTVTLCQGLSFVFDGDTLTTAGIYTATIPGTNGCDSTATLDLSFVPFFETAVQQTICNGETFEFGGEVLGTEGVYVDSLISGGGCDSIVILTLTVLPTVENTILATICANESYEFNGTTLTESGTYPVVLTSANGCDSTTTLVLTVLPLSITNTSATICGNETYPFGGLVLSTSGTYTASLTSSAGCDSLVVLTLTVQPLAGYELFFSVCAGETVAYEGDILTSSGAYIYTYPNASVNGCDSVVTVNVTVLPLASSTLAFTICAGESYTYNGETLNTSGAYTYVFAGVSVNGCDSVVTLNLTVLPAIPPTTVAATICAGEVYEINGVELFASGTFPITLISSVGCDSTVIVVLTVNTVNNTVSLQNGTLTAQAANATYQWINCTGNTPIAGATGSSYTPTLSGTYAVIITQNGCTATSDCQEVIVVSSYEPLAASSWSVQPNPARTYASVVLKGDLVGATRIEMYDASGRLLQKQTVPTGTTQVDLDLAGLPDGLLLLRLVNEQAASTKRLIKEGN